VQGPVKKDTINDLLGEYRYVRMLLIADWRCLVHSAIECVCDTVREWEVVILFAEARDLVS
jgi:hypothetical protein